MSSVIAKSRIQFNTGEEYHSMETDELLKHCYLQPEDSVIIGGSLIEGIGNPYSDIDVYVLTKARRKSETIDVREHHRVLDTNRCILRAGDQGREVFLVHTIVPGTKIKVDVEFRTYDEINTLKLEIDQIFEYAVNNLFLLTKSIVIREKMFMNRLYNSEIIRGKDRIEVIRQELDIGKYSYICYRWLASDFSVLLDILGAVRNGEMDRAIDRARENVISQTMAVLHLAGFINAGTRKWVPSYLKKSDFPERMKKCFFELYCFQDTQSSEDKLSYVANSFDYVDELHAIASVFLDNNPQVPSGEEAIIKLGQQRSSEGKEEFSRWEYDYRARVYSARPYPTSRLLEEQTSVLSG